ncbi:hypothetical protein [Cellulosimicrobium sp. NPDC057127]|uniref:hypothetical protein n=1 Tax=Cellulosimicrobium sp. NPDC057127 TaxID=3346026 RepID=UPI00363BA169
MSRRPPARTHLPAPVRRAAPAATLVVLATAGLVTVGASPAHALALGAAGLSAVLLWFGTANAPDHTWPDLPDPERHGARRDVAELGWGVVGKDGRANGRATRRVRDLAERHLAHHGNPGDLADPDVARRAAPLLGHHVAHGLHTHATHGRLPTQHELHTWIDAVERLATQPPHEGTTR